MGLRLAWLIFAFAVLVAPARAERVRIGAQMSGTLGWELKYMQAQGLDKAAGVELEIVDLATPEAGKIAIASGAVDLILSDWLWVARERSLGNNLAFVPHSAALGAVMVKGDSPISELKDLDGKTIGVSGGPLDKSWLLLQAYAKRGGFDLAQRVHVAYAAPPLIDQKLSVGELDAALQYWNFCVGLQTRGFRPLVEIADVEKALGATGAVALIGFVFKDEFAREHGPALEAFLSAARKAKQGLADDRGAWPALMARAGVKDPATVELYRIRYALGVASRPVAEEEADAKVLFAALAGIGGQALVGSAKTLDANVYYKPHSGD